MPKVAIDGTAPSPRSRNAARSRPIAATVAGAARPGNRAGRKCADTVVRVLVPPRSGLAAWARPMQVARTADAGGVDKAVTILAYTGDGGLDAASDRSPSAPSAGSGGGGRATVVSWGFMRRQRGAGHAKKCWIWRWR